MISPTEEDLSHIAHISGNNSLGWHFWVYHTIPYHGYTRREHGDLIEQRDLTRSVRLITERAIPVTNCYCSWVTTLFKVGVETGIYDIVAEDQLRAFDIRVRRWNMSL